MEGIWNRVLEVLAVYGLKVVAAVAVLIIGRLVAKVVQRIVEGIMAKGKQEQTLISFVSHLTYAAMMAFVVIAALGQLGIQTASFVAILGAAGLAIGLALQGSLANFAAGVLMIIFKPFKVGDFVEGGGVSGVVEEIQIFTTQLKTPDNKLVIVPNAHMTSDNIINYSAKGTRRIDLVASIGYGDDIDKARGVLQSIVAAENRILKEPEPKIAVSELGESSVDFVVRPWTTVADYWDVKFALTEAIKKQFDANGISIPFPQRDVHLYEHKAADK
ncbi:MAG: mechanosensitive ion channel [Candidatus Nealsonbacteria bacterium]|nr:mechanosensitive ion channel [Candidatus Nealsonbacteria bacterium]